MDCVDTAAYYLFHDQWCRTVTVNFSGLHEKNLTADALKNPIRDDKVSFIVLNIDFVSFGGSKIILIFILF